MSDSPRPLPDWLRPQLHTIDLAIGETQIDRVQLELAERAAGDTHGCMGYFPGMSGVAGIVHDLPESRRFAERVPSIVLETHALFFSFLRYSRIRQSAQAALHLDTDARTALTGDVSTMHLRLVVRLLINLSSITSRRFAYADLDASSVRIDARGGYLFCADAAAAQAVRTLALPPRRGSTVHGVLLHTNRVLHSGVDDETGHFVAGFGRDDG